MGVQRHFGVINFVQLIYANEHWRDPTGDPIINRMITANSTCAIRAPYIIHWDVTMNLDLSLCL